MEVKLSIDCNGAGYRSLRLLSELDLDYLQINKSFIQGGKSGNKNDNIVRSMIAFANMMSIKVVAVAVESEQQYAYLNAAGVDYMQGYFLSEP